MSRQLLAITMFVSSLLVAGDAFGQPLLDRVLDRVQGELNDRTQPAPANDDPLLEDNGPGDAAPAKEEPGYLGVVADDREEQGRGVRVLEVVAGGPAAQGGLAKNDLITAINAQPIRSMDEMARILSTMPAGARLAFSVNRGGASRNVSVTLGQRPGPGDRRFEKFGRQPEELPNDSGPVIQGARPKLGVRTLPVTQQAQEQFNLPSRDGAIVVAVTPDSPADQAGIRLGAVIVNVDGTAVKNPDQLADLVAASGARGQMTVTVLQDGRQSRLTVSFDDAPARVVPDAPIPDSPVQDEPRLDAIERRLQELEDRIEKIEQAIEKKT